VAASSPGGMTAKQAAQAASTRTRALSRNIANDGFYGKSATAATFLVEVDDQPIGRFHEVSGLSVEVGVDTVEEGGQNHFVHKLPGRMSWPNVVLKRGLTETDNLLAWLNKSSGDGFAGQQNKVTRSTLAVVLVAADGHTRLRAWNFEGAFPVKWTGPSFAYSSSDAADEELEIAHHGFKAVTPSG
jgi:phage tail-like protein